MEPRHFEVLRQIPGAGSVALVGEELGPGADAPPVVLLHGLSATRRNVLQGSSALARAGYRLVSYDARGHGESAAAPAYSYPDLVGDLEAVLAFLGLERVVLVGSSMGAATAMAFALREPARVRALVQITPAYTGAAAPPGRWEELAGALERGGIDAFVDLAVPDTLSERWREASRTATRQRMERHAALGPAIRALREVPQSVAWEGMERLDGLEVPTLVVGSRDEPDPMHPLAVAEEYARRLPRGELVVEDEGQTPLAWQGARLSKAIAEFLARVGYS